jgi:hypothetical protein
MSDTTYRGFLGDDMHDFCLTMPMVIELERICHAGIGGIVRRVVAQEFTAAEVTETIRLALIGAGTDPEEAAALIAAYVTPAPLVKSYTLATAILQTLMLGPQPVVQPRPKIRKKANA